MSEQNEPAAAHRLKVLEPVLQCPTHGCALAFDSTAGAEGEFRCEQGPHAFDIVDGILDMIVVDGDADPDEASVRDDVERWYEEIGWRRADDGKFEDTRMFGSASRPQGYGLYARGSHLSFLDLLDGGGFLLDAGCGGGADPEYQAYSWFYDQRVCIDISRRALMEARRMYGPSALYVRADLWRLPFASERFDGVVSGYVVQHIGADLQAVALTELYRVITPGSRVLIMSGVKKSISHRLLAGVLSAVSFVGRLGRSNRASEKTAEQREAAKRGAELYYHPRKLGWWKKLGRKLGGSVDTRCLRVLKRKQFDSMFGATSAKGVWLRRFERAFPRLLARASRYALIGYRKPKRDDR